MIKVFIVDDELFLRKGLGILIEWDKLGFEICGYAENGIHAIKMINELKPDIIITDIKMPLMDGISLIKALREEHKSKAKFIIISEYDEFAYVKAALRYNVKAYILKPIDKVELINVLSEIRIEIDDEITEEISRKEGLKAIAENTIKSLINGNFDDEVIGRAQSFLDLKDCKDFRYVIIETERSSLLENKTSSKDLKIKIKSLIEELLANGKNLNIVELEEVNGRSLKIGVIITSKIISKNHSDIKNVMDQLYKSILNRAKVKVKIYIGTKVKTIERLQDAYDSALLVKSYGNMLDKNNIIYYEDIMNKPFKKDIGGNSNFDLILETIEDSNLEGIEEITETIFDKFKNEFVDPKVINLSINYLFYQMLKIISKMSGDITEILYKYSLPKLDLSKLTLEQTKQKVIEFSIESSKNIKSLRMNQAKGVLFKVEKYINENYDKSLTLKGIASIFFLNSAYLGQIFKREFGISFNEYLLKLRIEKAKEILLRTDMKIYEVSAIVGYKDVDYFVTNFEKLTKITPLQYRKSKQI